jgi:type IV pilus assembly protein PilC
MRKKILTNMYISTLCLELNMLISAGITIKDGVAMMLDDEADERRIILQSLHKSLSEGAALSDAMRDTDFPHYMVSMIKIGERAGKLCEALKALSKHYERHDRLLSSIKDAILYPAILLAMMLIVVIILVVRVLPVFSDIFGRMGAQMSPFALRLMLLGEWLRSASVAVAVAIFFILAAIFIAWIVPGIRQTFAQFFKNNWGNRWVFGRLAFFQFVSSMSLAMESGLEIEDSLKLSADLNNNSAALNSKYEKCKSLLKNGNSLADALREAGILSARDGRILSIGDTGGMADFAMAEIARRSDRSLRKEIASIVGKIEPTLVIITSVIVAVILLSVMLPLIGIMTSI